MSFEEGLAWAVGGGLAVAGVTAAARPLRLPAPLTLIVVGAVVGFVPGVPEFRLDPEVVLAGVLPALLFSAGFRTSSSDLRARLDSVVALSVGLVLFSVVAIGVASWLVLRPAFPSFTLAAGLALGAILAPTDTVSVGALASSGRLPRRLAALLENEGLLNDATALVALNTAIAAIAVPRFHPGGIVLDFAIALLGGVGVGLVAAVVMSRLRDSTRSPAVGTTLSFATPYVAFLPAAVIGGSGFLAAAVAGIWFGNAAPGGRAAVVRVSERLGWQTISFLLENAAFLLIGLQLPAILRGAASSVDPVVGALLIAAVYGVTTLTRFAYIFASTAFFRHGPRGLRGRAWDWRTALASSSAGVRGVVTLAAVLLLPPTTPALEFVQLAAIVIVIVSVAQGLLLAPLVRALRMELPDDADDAARVRALTGEIQGAAIRRLQAHTHSTAPAELIQHLRRSAEYRRELGRAQTSAPRTDLFGLLRLEMIDAERTALLRIGRRGRYRDDEVRAVLFDLDVTEAALRRSTSRDRSAAD